MKFARLVIVMVKESGEVSYAHLFCGTLTRKKLWAAPTSCQSLIKDGQVVSVRKEDLMSEGDDCFCITVPDNLEILQNDARFQVEFVEDVDVEILEGIYGAMKELNK